LREVERVGDTGSIAMLELAGEQNLAGTVLIVLTRRVGERPAWSKRGIELLFTAGRIFVVRRDGSGLTSIPRSGSG
jgi:hypothetical protein